MKFNFTKKLIIVFLLVIIFMATAISIFTYNYNYTIKEKEIYENAQNQSFEIDNNLSTMFSQIKNNVEFLDNSPDILKADSTISAIFNLNPNIVEKKYSKNIPGIESSIYDEFERFGSTHPYTTNIYLGTIWGGYIQYPDGVIVNKYDPRLRPWYEEAIKTPNEVVISTPYKDYNTNRAMISASSIVKNKSGKIVGVIGLDVTLNYLSKIISSNIQNNDSYSFVFTKDGTIIAHPNNKLNFKNIKGLNLSDNYNISNYSKFFTEKNSDFETIINGQDVFVNVYNSSINGWKIATVTPKSILTTEVNNTIYFIIFISVILIIISLIIVIMILKKITTPISELTSLMKEAEEGNLCIQSNINTNDEFQRLGNSFNSMIKQLKLNYEELAALYEQLAATEGTLRTQYDELQYSQKILKKGEERYRLALDGANDAIWELDLENHKFFVSDKFYEMTGYKRNSKHKIKYLFNNLIHPKDKSKAKDALLEHINNNTPLYQSEFRIKKEDDSYIWIYNRGKALRNENGQATKLAGSITDITDRKVSEKKILYMAHYDELTNLPNRSYFMNKVDEKLIMAEKNNTKFVILFIDLDNFKIINDTLGHDLGDMLLKNISNKFKNLIYKSDLVCRLGGDEFVILHKFEKEEDIILIADKIIDMFKNSFEIADKQIFITASIGISVYPEDGNDVKSILKNSDAAMYKAKELGKNRYAFYDKAMFLKLQRKNQIQNILRKVIENNELLLYFQPQYNPNNNEIFGFEALLRLKSKELGFISPMEFIPVAEETGYINSIGKWVLEEAVKQCLKWIKSGFKFKSISINISAAQLNQPNFYNMICDTINKYKIDPTLIELEITETLLMQSIDANIKILDKLMKMGIRIALDDFGTGYSSLNYLREIPISTLKVDKSFIDNMTSNTKEGKIIKNILEMAHSMDLKVIAEGVENEQQLMTLKNMNCDYIQGYYYSKPLPANEIEELLKKNCSALIKIR